MAIDEGARHALHGRLDAVLGREEAVTLMAHLPPIGWQDVATRSDLAHLAAATKRDLDALGDKLRAEFHQSQVAQTRTLVFSMISVMLILSTMAFGAARIL